MASEDADSSWRAFLPLWAALIKGEDLPAQDAARLGSQLHGWAQPLYDALLTAALDALRNLDLTYHQSAELPEAPTNAASDLAITEQVKLLLCPSLFLPRMSHCSVPS